ncbi:MAG: GNAT family N-acetyltransferase [Candidatus Bathyarchaeia archaeon]
MPQKQPDTPNLQFYPLTPERWADLEKLFRPRGACGGCWCMWWRLPRSQFMKQRGDENRKALKNLVETGEVPGILAYAEDKPVGWCAVAPREFYSALERYRILKRVDDKPVWSIVCFFVAKSWRGIGVTIQLLKAAVDYVKRHGGKIVEAILSTLRRNESQRRSPTLEWFQCSARWAARKSFAVLKPAPS